MLISLIIPVYNVAPYIIRCLDSVMKQDYTGSMECILVNDCSEDQSIALAQEAIDAYSGPICFSIIPHDRNRGLSAARNTGIEASRGDYLYFLDADDWIASDGISAMVAMVVKFPSVEMVQAGAIPHGGTEPWLNMQDCMLPEFIQGKENVRPVMLNRDKLPVTAWNRLVRKSFLLRKNLFFQEGLIHEDELWTFQLAMHLSSLAILRQNTYHYEHRESGLMSRPSAQKDASLVTIAQQMIAAMDNFCIPLSVSYIADFIHLRSFNITDETQRIAMIEHIPQLYPYWSFFRKLNARMWLFMSKMPIRNHYWLYSLLYHWRIGC